MWLAILLHNLKVANAHPLMVNHAISGDLLCDLSCEYTFILNSFAIVFHSALTYYCYGLFLLCLLVTVCLRVSKFDLICDEFTMVN